MRLPLLLAGVATLSLGAFQADRASAAIMLANAGGSAALGNLDAGGLADASVTPGAPTSFDILYTTVLDDLSGGFSPGVEWGFQFQINDSAEVLLGTVAIVYAPGVSGVSTSDGGGGIFGTYQALAPLSDGTRIATVSFISGAVGAAPDDDAADVSLAGLAGAPLVTAEPDPGSALFPGIGAEDQVYVYDAVYGFVSPNVGYDLQLAAAPPVPLPAPAFLLLGGLAGLAGLRRRG